MRRTTSETIAVTRYGDRLAARILAGDLDADFVISVLESYASEARRERLIDVFSRRINSVTLVLDALHDPHNGAALLRTSDAMGLTRVHVIERKESFLAHAGVARGTHKWVEVVAHKAAADCVQMLKASGHTLVATHPAGDLVPEDLAKLPRVALVMGNEHEGIGKDLRDACEHAVRVPMRGFAESLNVSVCGGILTAFAASGRSGDLDPEERRRLYARGLAVSVPHAADILDVAASRR